MRRENEQLSGYTNATSSRAKLIDSLKLLVKENRILQDKLIFPCVNNSALSSLIKLICPSFEKETKVNGYCSIHFLLFCFSLISLFPKCVPSMSFSCT